MDLRALRRQRITRQHGVVLPAVQTADPAIRTLVDLQANGVAVSPNRALVKGRLDLAMTAKNTPFIPDEEESAVDAAARDAVALSHTDHDIDAGLARRFAETVGFRPWDFHRVIEIFGHRLKCQCREWRMGEEW